MLEYREAFDLMCGTELGTGISRRVYECCLLDGYVVKVEEGNATFQNVMEMLIWRSVAGTKAERWFAECKAISPNGRVMLQERTRPASQSELLEMVPVWFTDLKPDNWGMVIRGDKEYLVCHDYGYNNTISHGTSTKRMKKADW